MNLVLKHRKENDMTQEDKKLLLKDLCARLLYGTIIRNYATDEVDVLTYSLLEDFEIVGLEYIKPYLRPMSSMTEEEKKIICSMNMLSDIELSDRLNYQKMYVQNYTIETFDLFNAHYLDYRGLIPMGLALEAPEDMYKN